MESQTAEKTPPRGLDAALLVFFLTVLAYIATYSYEVAYLSYFGLPHSLANLDLKDLLSAGLLLVALTSSVWIALDAATDLWSKVTNRRIWSRALWLLAMSLLIVLGGWLTDKRWYSILFWIIALQVGPLCNFILPLFGKGGFGRYLERVNQMIDHGGSYEGGGMRAVVARFGAGPTQVVLGLVFAYGIGAVLGTLTAKLSGTFAVSETRPECIVMRTGPEIVCQLFDRKAHVLKPQYRLIAQEGVHEFTLENLGSFPELDVRNLPAANTPSDSWTDWAAEWAKKNGSTPPSSPPPRAESQ